MKRDNKTQYALLGILTQCDSSGYDIKKFIETSIGYFWQESYGQIYPNLKKMEKAGLIESRHIAESKGSEKIIYSITDAGRQKLTGWLSQPVENPGYRNELLLKVFFGNQMNIADIESLITSKKTALEQTLNEYHTIEKNINHKSCESVDRPFWLITLDFGIRATIAELDWIRHVEKFIKKNKRKDK